MATNNKTNQMPVDDQRTAEELRALLAEKEEELARLRNAAKPAAVPSAYSEDAEQLRQMGYLEPLRIAMKLGVDIDETDMIKNRAHFKVAPFSNKPSTRLDIEAKRPTEVEAFSGVVMRLGKQVGVETPVNTWLYHAIRLLEMMNRGEVDEQKWREAGAVFPEY